MRFLSIVFILCCFLSLPIAGSAQNNAGFGIEANFMAGKVLKHNARFTVPIPALSTAFELAAIRQTDGRQAWEQRRHYPLWGVGATYTSYGLDSVYGKAIGVYPMLQFVLARRKSFEWTFRFGLGIGYITRHFQYSAPQDTLNDAISTHVNNFSMFATDLRWRIDTHWDVQAGLSFSHISNAAYQEPNLGINMYSARIGVRYFPAASKPARISQSLPPLSNRLLVQARLGLAFNGDGNSGGPAYRTYLATAYVSRRCRSKNKLYLGLDYSYHELVYAFLKNNEIFPGTEAAHSWKSAVIAGAELLYGRGALIGQVGYYLQESYLKQEKIYEKFGYHFYLLRRERGGLKELFLSGLIKTHLTRAELAEFGFGVGF